MINKKIMVIIAIVLMTGVGMLVYDLVSFNNIEVIETTEKDKKNNMLTMMLETEAETGNYEETTASEWPQDGYVFNASLSRCENGGTLSWDDETKKVLMESNSSDKCYVYFDKSLPTFAEYIINEVYTSDGLNGLYYHDGIGTSSDPYRLSN